MANEFEKYGIDPQSFISQVGKVRVIDMDYADLPGITGFMPCINCGELMSFDEGALERAFEDAWLCERCRDENH